MVFVLLLGPGGGCSVGQKLERSGFLVMLMVRLVPNEARRPLAPFTLPPGREGEEGADEDRPVDLAPRLLLAEEPPPPSLPPLLSDSARLEEPCLPTRRLVLAAAPSRSSI